MTKSNRVWVFSIGALIAAAVLLALWTLHESAQQEAPTSPRMTVVSEPNPEVAPASAAALDPPISPDRAAYPADAAEPDAAAAARAGLVVGEYVAVVLDVGVLKDNSLSTIDVEHSSGTPQADAAAINYVRSLHWVCAVKRGHAASSIVRTVVRFHR